MLLPMPSSYGAGAAAFGQQIQDAKIQIVSSSMHDETEKEFSSLGRKRRRSTTSSSSSSASPYATAANLDSTNTKFPSNMASVRVERIQTQVFEALTKVLCDNDRTHGKTRWLNVMLDEKQKTSKKRMDLTVKWMKTHKSNHPGISPNIIQCISTVMNNTRDLRVPTFPREEIRRRIASECSECISSMILTLNRLQPGCIPDHRIHAMSVGLLYLMRWVEPSLRPQHFFSCLPRYLSLSLSICKCNKKLHNTTSVYMRVRLTTFNHQFRWFQHNKQ